MEQTKVIQEIVSPEVSELNHFVINKKQGDQRQFSQEKRLEKRKRIHHSCQPIIPVDGLYCVKKYGNRFIDSARNFFICLKMFIIQ